MYKTDFDFVLYNDLGRSILQLNNFTICVHLKDSNLLTYCLGKTFSIGHVMILLEVTHL